MELQLLNGIIKISLSSSRINQSFSQGNLSNLQKQILLGGGGGGGEFGGERSDMNNEAVEADEGKRGHLCHLRQILMFGSAIGHR